MKKESQQYISNEYSGQLLNYKYFSDQIVNNANGIESQQQYYRQNSFKSKIDNDTSQSNYNYLLQQYSQNVEQRFRDVLKNKSGIFQDDLYVNQEIQRSLEVLKKHIPDIFSQDLINSIFNFLFQTSQTQQFQQKQQKSTIIQRGIKNKLKTKGSINKSNSLKDITVYNNKKAIISTKDKEQNFRIAKRYSNSGVIIQKTKERAFETFKKIKLNQQKQIKILKQSFDKIWKQILLSQALSLYKQQKSISSIKDYLIQKYPEYRQYLSLHFLKNKFNRIFRLAFKKIHSWIDQYGQYENIHLVPLNQYKINYIMSYDSAYHIRLKLLEIVQDKDINIHLVTDTINIINHFVEKFIISQRADKCQNI